MAKYTVEERDILEEMAGYDEEASYAEIDDVIDKAWDKVFTTETPFFDEDYRAPLCKKILKHYYMREIGQETVGLWKYYMNMTLEEQMPYYNQLYKSALLKFPIFSNTNMKTKSTRENTGETTSNETGSEEGTNNNTLTSNRDTINNGTVDTQENGTNDGTSDTQTSRDMQSEQNEKGSQDTRSESETEGWNEEEGNNSEQREDSKTGETSNSGQTGETDNASHTDTTITDTTSQSTNTHWDLYSDTPQGGLDNIVKADGTEADTQYLTNFRKTTDDTNNKGNQTETTTGSSTDNKTGTTSESGNSSENSNGSTFGEYEKEGRNGNESTETSHTDTTDNTTREENETGTSNTQTHDENEVESHQQTHNEETSNYVEDANGKYDKGTVFDALGSSHDMEEFAERTLGKSGGDTYAEMLMKFRDTFLNIDMDVINKFEECFMQLW